MKKSNVEQLYEWLNGYTEEVMQHLYEPYLDSLTEVMETLFYEAPADDLDDILKKKLEVALTEIKSINYTLEDLRKAIQLAILNGMKGTTQEQHLMTPESIGLIVGYLANQLMADKKELSLFDPASGTGNLLITVMERLSAEKKAYASEVDPTLIQLSAILANLQKREIQFFHQDSLRPLLLDPVDLVVSDLPVGYYPDDVQASEYKLMADEGHAFSHHLFIEQSLRYTKEAGYLIFVVPDFLFDSEQSDKLNHFLRENAHIIGVLRLPETIFKAKRHVKSIVILQKKGENTKNPKQPLLVQMPDLNNQNAMADILKQMNLWFDTYK
ncbi:class I SAM-dependent methyltransferase [Oceanobacillus sp. CAU 1775]